MTSNKLSSLTRIAPVLSLLLVATILFVGPLATVQQTASSTTALTDEEEDVLETQDTATENLTEEDRDVNGIEFTPRWGDISTLEPDSIDVLFADCLEDEFAVSSQFVFETSDVIASQSFPVAFEDDDDETAMSWLAVVENTHGTEDKAASIGVICASENGGDDDDDDNDGNIDVSTKTTIKNIIKNFIRVENNEIVNLNNIINIRQQIIQNAMQILSITGNNNTVSQVINQAATQIANVNATTPTEIQQIIDQNAQQQGVISGTGNQTSLSQMIDQEAAQQANVTEEEEGGATDIDQAIDQGAEQAANVTEEEEGGATDIDQAIDQGAEQAANVTEEEEGGATDIDQAIDQGAEQAANVTNGGGADTSIIDQLIQERAQQQAQVDEQQQQQPGEGGATDIDQAIGQNASQQAQVNDGGEVLGNSTGD
jgi:creatinine amidohydrolase/Fe(II)-dependent formamide hydrolase-like protein